MSSSLEADRLQRPTGDSKRSLVGVWTQAAQSGAWTTKGGASSEDRGQALNRLRVFGKGYWKKAKSRGLLSPASFS